MSYNALCQKIYDCVRNVDRKTLKQIERNVQTWNKNLSEQVAAEDFDEWSDVKPMSCYQASNGEIYFNHQCDLTPKSFYLKVLSIAMHLNEYGLFCEYLRRSLHSLDYQDILTEMAGYKLSYHDGKWLSAVCHHNAVHHHTHDIMMFIVKNARCLFIMSYVLRHITFPEIKPKVDAEKLLTYAFLSSNLDFIQKYGEAMVRADIWQADAMLLQSLEWSSGCRIRDWGIGTNFLGWRDMCLHNERFLAPLCRSWNAYIMAYLYAKADVDTQHVFRCQCGGSDASKVAFVAKYCTQAEFITFMHDFGFKCEDYIRIIIAAKPHTWRWLMSDSVGITPDQILVSALSCNQVQTVRAAMALGANILQPTLPAIRYCNTAMLCLHEARNRILFMRRGFGLRHAAARVCASHYDIRAYRLIIPETCYRLLQKYRSKTSCAN